MPLSQEMGQREWVWNFARQQTSGRGVSVTLASPKTEEFKSRVDGRVDQQSPTRGSLELTSLEGRLL